MFKKISIEEMARIEARISALEEGLVQLTAGYATIVQVMEKLHQAVIMQQRYIERNYSAASLESSSPGSGAKVKPTKADIH